MFPGNSANTSIYPSAMCHTQSLCPFSLQDSTRTNCSLCSSCHFCKVSIPQLFMLLVQPIHLWEFPMEMTVNTDQLLHLSAVSSVIAFCACVSSSMGMFDQGKRRLMVTSNVKRQQGKILPVKGSRTLQANTLQELQNPFRQRIGYPKMRLQSLCLEELLPCSRKTLDSNIIFCNQILSSLCSFWLVWHW